MKKTLRLVLSLVLVIGLAAPVSAAPASGAQTIQKDNMTYIVYHGTDNGITPYWTYFSTLSVGFEISGKTAIADVTLRAYDTTRSITLKVELQKLVGSTWQTQTTWTASGKGSVNIDKSSSVSSGTYRLLCTGTTTGETITAQSGSATC